MRNITWTNKTKLLDTPHSVVYDDGMMFTAERPDRTTYIPVPRTDDFILVSSRHGVLNGSYYLNETCVFFPNDHSDVRGTYDDHDKIVKEIRHA